LNLDDRLAQLLHAAHARGAAVAHEANCLAMPFRINPVDRVLEHSGGTIVVFRSDEDEPIGLRDRGGPSLNDLILEGRPAGRRRRHWLIEERHRKIAQIEQPRVDSSALLEMLKNPVGGPLRETAFAGTANNDGNDVHA